MHITGKVAEISGLKHLAAAGYDLKNLQLTSAASNLIEGVCRLGLTAIGTGAVVAVASLADRKLYTYRNEFMVAHHKSIHKVNAQTYKSGPTDLYYHNDVMLPIQRFCSDLYTVKGISYSNNTPSFANRCVQSILATNDELISNVILDGEKTRLARTSDDLKEIASNYDVLAQTLSKYCMMEAPKIDDCKVARDRYEANKRPSSRKTMGEVEEAERTMQAACEPTMFMGKIEKCFSNLLATSNTNPTLHRLLGAKDFAAFRKSREVV